MDTISQAGDSDRLNDLLRRMGEFIAYFEIAETKMLEWQHDINYRLTQHDERVDKQLHNIAQLNQSFTDVLTEAGAARWRIAAENALKQGEQHCHSLEYLGNEMLDKITHKHQEMTTHTQAMLEQIEAMADAATEKITQAINKANLNQLEQVTTQALNKNQKIVKSFTRKNTLTAMAISMVTALTIGLYLSDELPWEIHQHAMQERKAGQALINAWPYLNQMERNKIVTDELRQALG